MSDTGFLDFPQAARRLGVSLRLLRHAIRSGRVPAPPHGGATAKLPSDWFDSAKAAIEASPGAMRSGIAQKVPAFARYEGTSAWRKYPVRVRGYARFKAAARHATPG